MNRVIEWFAGNPIAANAVVLIPILAGLLSLRQIEQALFPEVSADTITITTEYPGSSPEEVQYAVCRRIEQAIYGTAGVSRLSSTAREGVCVMSIELSQKGSVAPLVDRIKARVNAIDSFPNGVEEPIVQEPQIDSPVIGIVVAGSVDTLSLRRYAEKVRDEISDLPGVSIARIQNPRSREVSIEVSEYALRRHGLDFNDLANAISRSSIDLPGGSLRSLRGEVLLRTRTQARSRPEFEEIVVLSRPDGTLLRLGEIAQIRDGLEKPRGWARYDGESAILVQAYRGGDLRILDVARSVRGYVEREHVRAGDEIELRVWQDSSLLLQARIDVLLQNAALGLVLVLVVLMLFLELRFALWVSLGLVVSILGAIALMPLLGLSINLVSLVALIIALGLVVDDAIVVAESIERHEQISGGPTLQSAIEGTEEIARPVIMASLTTMLAVAPALLISTLVGRMARAIPLILLAVLIISLLECFLALPNHLARKRAASSWLDQTGLARRWREIRRSAAGGLARFTSDYFEPLLIRSLQNRVLVLAIAGAVMALGVGVLASGRLGFVLFLPIEDNFASALVRMPAGTSPEATELAALQLERSAKQLGAEFENGERGVPRRVVEHIMTYVGSQPSEAMNSPVNPFGRQGFVDTQLAEVKLQLAPSSTRAVSLEDLVARWRALTGPIAGAEELRFRTTAIPLSNAIEIDLSAPDFETLMSASADLKAALRTLPGVRAIGDSFEGVQPEIQLTLRPHAEVIGVSGSDIAHQVRQGFHGEEVQQLLRGRDEIPVVVRYPAAESRSIGDLESILIRTPQGNEVPFFSVATATVARGAAQIHRTDRRRVLSVSVEVDGAMANANELVETIRQEILPALGRKHHRLDYSFSGQQSEAAATLVSSGGSLVLAMVSIYLLLAVYLRSYWQPLLILLAPPFGHLGAVAGHALLGLPLSAFAMVAVLALTGVLVNDSLLLVTTINGLRATGRSTFESVREASAIRLRPIFLTSLTTIAALMPMLVDGRSEVQLLRPIAVTFVFGEIVSTFAILVLIPAAYLVEEDIRLRRGSPQPALAR